MTKVVCYKSQCRYNNGGKECTLKFIIIGEDSTKCMCYCTEKNFKANLKKWFGKTSK